MKPARELPLLHKGDVIGEGDGQYVVQRKLGEGQFAEVWEVKQVNRSYEAKVSIGEYVSGQSTCHHNTNTPADTPRTAVCTEVGEAQGPQHSQSGVQGTRLKQLQNLATCSSYLIGWQLPQLADMGGCLQALNRLRGHSQVIAVEGCGTHDERFYMLLQVSKRHGTAAPVQHNPAKSQQQAFLTNLLVQAGRGLSLAVVCAMPCIARMSPLHAIITWIADIIVVAAPLCLRL